MVTNGITSPRYTPLESLLFFQSLRAQDLTSIDFDSISEDLVSLPLIKNDDSFDRERLSADGLQKLYLKLLKNEAREEQAASREQTPTSRKRKAASPSLPTVEAAAKHAHLLPGLLIKLYSRYRDDTIRAIKEEEETIDRLAQEIEQIEAGELDEQLQSENGLGIKGDTDRATASPARDLRPRSSRGNTANDVSQTQRQPSPSNKQLSPLLPAGQANTKHSSPSSQHTASPSRAVPIAPAAKGLSPVMPNGLQHPHGQSPILPAGYSSPSQQQIPGQPAGRGYPLAPQYPHIPPPYPPQSQTPQQQQQYQIRPSQQGGFQLPPFQVSAQEPSKVHHQHPAQPQLQQSRHSTPHGTPRPGHTAPQTPQGAPQALVANDRLTESVVASLRKRRSTSTWKASPHPSPVAPSSPKRPAAEPITPSHTEKKERQKTPSALQDTDGARREKSDKKTTRKTRATSVASSSDSITERTRSRSVVSPAPPQGASARRQVKLEDTAGDVETPHPRNTRTRRSTLPPASASSAARRSPRTTPRPEAFVPPRNDLVYATRNFSRLSAVIMNEISAHRHAGPFQKPVSDRDVEGYHSIIKRPQDLKSIKAAITAGSRAVAAAQAAQPEEESSSSTAILLPKTDDLLPPKGIINPAQLEKEVLRMFANAVLFNPGDDGFVVDAREMAEDIASKIQDWRGVEREAGEDDDGAGSKRRKL